MKNNTKEIGKRLKEIRERSGKNQTELAKKIGCSKFRLCRCENGVIIPSLNILRHYCESGKASMDYIVFGTEASMSFELKHALDRIKKEDQDAIIDYLICVFSKGLQEQFTNASIKDRMKELRIGRNLLPIQLSRKIDFSDSAIVKCENDKITPSLKMLLRYHNVFDVPLDYLAFGVQQQTYPQKIEEFLKHYNYTTQKEILELFEKGFLLMNDFLRKNS